MSKNIFLLAVVCLSVALSLVKNAQASPNSQDPRLYWPFLADSHSTYHADAYRSDSSPIELAARYRLGGKQGRDSMVLVSATLDNQLGRSYFPALTRPQVSSFFAYKLTSTRGDGAEWTEQQLPVAIDSCAFPFSATIDAEHNLYFSDCRYLYSTTANGKLRWQSPLPRIGAEIVSFIEVFFTGRGDVGGVTSAGVLALYDRQTGRQKRSYQLPNVKTTSSPVKSAVANAPASMIDQANPENTAVFVVGVTNRDPDGDGRFDLGLYRLDIVYGLDGLPTVQTRYVTIIANGNGSATTPTISPNGRDVYISDASSSYLWSISTESGKIQWAEYVGHQQGSVAVSREEQYRVFTGAGDRELVILDPNADSKVLIRRSYDELAEQVLPLRGSLARRALISTNILATPSKLIFVVTLGYDTSSLGKKILGLWPVKALLLTTDLNGKPLSSLSLPTTSDVTLSISADKRVFIPAADIQALSAAMAIKQDPTLLDSLGEPLKPVGGVYVAEPF